MREGAIAATVVFALCGMSLADTVVWEQLPASEVGGAATLATWSHTNPGNLYFYDQRLGDNFVLSSTQSITSVDWWGYDSVPGFASFTIAFFTTADLATGVPTYSEVVPLASITTTGPASGYFDSRYSATFAASVVLAPDTYWLAISADVDPGTSQGWAWMGADSGEQYDVTMAIDSDLTNSEWDGTFGPLGFPYEDRSFRLYAEEGHMPVVPLPPAAWAGLTGLGLLAGSRALAKRRR